MSQLVMCRSLAIAAKSRFPRYSYSAEVFPSGRSLSLFTRTFPSLLLKTLQASTMESSQNTLRSYAQALLKLMGKRPGADDPKEDQPFGWARHLETQKTTYAQSVHKLLHALIEYSPSPEKVAQDFLD